MLRTLFGVLFLGGAIGLLIWLLVWYRSSRNQQNQVSPPRPRMDVPDWHEAVNCEIEFAPNLLLACRLVVYGWGVNLVNGFKLFNQPASFTDLCTLTIRTRRNRVAESISATDHNPPGIETRDIANLRRQVSDEIQGTMCQLLLDGGLTDLPTLVTVLAGPRWIETERAPQGTQQMSLLELSRDGLSIEPMAPDVVALRLLAESRVSGLQPVLRATRPERLISNKEPA